MMEVTIVGGPFDGEIFGVPLGSTDLHLNVKTPVPAAGDNTPWVPFYEIGVPIHLTRNGYRAKWSARAFRTLRPEDGTL
jgi:hypothetical protein